MFQKTVAEKIKHTLCSVTSFSDNVKCEKKKGTAGQAASDNIKPRMRVACQITKATEHTQNM